ncbi:MAG: hypothetical protein DRI48_06600 [Chloroflexi bacterium]|nr:MAG: hypothetical protein DRI48_06600 [Chloroflexota bacterium]
MIDPLGGEVDLKAKRIRATSDRIFRQDAVRLLRAVRIEAELGFEIEPQTAAWIRRDAPLLTQSSAERVRDEFVRLLAMQGAAAHVQRLDEFGLVPYVVPELESLKSVAQSPPHRFDVWRHTLLTLDTLERVVAAITGGVVKPSDMAGVPSVAWGDLARTLSQFASDLAAHLSVEVGGGRKRALVLKLAALLHDLGKPATRSQDEEGNAHFYNHEPVGARMAALRLRELRFSGNEIERMQVLVGQHLRPAHLARAERLTRRAVYRYFRATGCAGVDVVLLSLSDHLATWGPNLRERRWLRRLEVAEILLSHWFERYEETVEPVPLLTGDDLIEELGLSPGPQIGRLLEAVREAQAAGEVGSREEALALSRRIRDSAKRSPI